MPIRSLARAAALIAFSLASAPALAVSGPWVVADRVEMRLLATGMADGPPQAALELRLDPGWKTYWRTPGESGLPTVFDFAGSWNVARIEAGFPAPQRHDDGTSVSNVYENRVVFPIALAPAFAGGPITINLRLSLGVCETVCIPEELNASLVVSLTEIDPAVQSLIQLARAQLPMPARPGIQEVTAIERLAGPDERPEFLVKVIAPAPDQSVLFAEGPAGWLPLAAEEVARDGNLLSYRIAFNRLANAAPAEPVELTLTLVSRGSAIEQSLAVPAR